MSEQLAISKEELEQTKDYILDDIPLDQIDFGDRVREDMGNIADLANDMSQNGVISPIAVLDKTQTDNLEDEAEFLDPSKRYLLLAGGRRTTAAMSAGLEEIPAKIYTTHLNEYQQRVIELHENIKRKSLTPYEDSLLKKEIHELYVGIYGESQKNVKGHSQADTAELFGVSRSSISKDLKIAEYADDIPEIKEAKTKSEANKLIKEAEQAIAREEKARRIQKNKEEETEHIEVEGGDGRVQKFQKDLIRRYIVGDYFEQIEKLPDRCVDIMELDPDWGIDFIKTRSGVSLSHNEYKEIPPDAYVDVLTQIVDKAVKKMKDHSWLLMWYSLQEWHSETFHVLREAGLSVCKMPAFWIKSTGNSKTPAFRLGDTAAAFFYARKGSPRLTKMARNNTFHFRTPKKNERTHPAEKPVELYEEMLRTFGKQGDVVVSGFAGSGNLLLAAENLQINGVAFDLSQKHKDDFILKVEGQQHGQYKSFQS